MAIHSNIMSMGKVNIILVICMIIIPTVTNGTSGGPKFWLDGTTYSKHGQNAPKNVMESLQNVGIGSDDLKRPAKQFLLDVYQQLQNGKQISSTLPVAGIKKKAIAKADTIRSFTAKVPTYEGKGKVKFTFNLTSVSRGEKTRHAELHVRPIRLDHDQHVHRFKVAVITESGHKGEKVMYRLSAKSKTYGGYLLFDVTDIIDDVLKKTKDDYEKVIRITIKHKESHIGSAKNKQKRSVTENPTLVSEDDGILILYTENKSFFKSFKSQVKSAAVKVSSQSNNGQRKKRDVDVTDSDRSLRRSKRSQKKKQCSKKDLTLNFEELGWGKWIIFPRSYNAMQCEGKCPSPVDWSFDPTNHSILQSLARLHDKKISRPCCVPTKLEPISMMYYEFDELVVRNHEDMSVGTCGCR